MVVKDNLYTYQQVNSVAVAIFHMVVTVVIAFLNLFFRIAEAIF